MFFLKFYPKIILGVVRFFLEKLPLPSNRDNHTEGSGGAKSIRVLSWSLQAVPRHSKTISKTLLAKKIPIGNPGNPAKKNRFGVWGGGRASFSLQIPDKPN